jgi:hypothetical protein
VSSRPLLAPNTDKPIINKADMSSGTITGPATIIQMLPGISYSFVWTGTPTGTFAIQVSNDYAQNNDGTVRYAGTWNTLPTASFQGTYPAPAGSAGNGFLDVFGTNAYAVRVVYTGTGAGNLTVVACSKVL